MERKPTWWLLYTIAALLTALVALIEISVRGAAARLTLELIAVVALFGLMLRWFHANRGLIELAEALPTRREDLDFDAFKREGRWRVPGHAAGQARRRN
jgi:hypothetical protein